MTTQYGKRWGGFTARQRFTWERENKLVHVVECFEVEKGYRVGITSRLFATRFEAEIYAASCPEEVAAKYIGERPFNEV